VIVVCKVTLVSQNYFKGIVRISAESTFTEMKKKWACNNRPTSFSLTISPGRFMVSPEFLIFPIFSNICYQNVDFRVTNGDENRFIMA